MDPFRKSPPQNVHTKLAELTSSGEEVLIQVATDLDDDQAFAENWVVLTDRRLLMIPAGGHDGTVMVPLEEVGDVRMEELVGAGRVELERKGGTPVYINYSNSLRPKLAEVAEGVRRLTKGEAVELPTELERSRCPACGRLVPEKDGACAACIKKWDALRRIAGYLKPYRSMAVGLAALAVGTPLIELIPPLIVWRIIDDVLVPRKDLDLLLWLTMGLLGIRVAQWGLEMGRGWLRAVLASRTGRDVRSDLYRHVQYMPVRFYDRRKLGSLISRFTRDCDRLEMFLLFGIPHTISNALTLVGLLVLLFYLNWELTLLLLTPVPLIAAASLLIWGRMRRYWIRWSAKWARLSAHLNEFITGIRIVKAFAQEDQEAARFKLRNDELRQVSVSAERTWVLFFAATNFVMGFGVFFLWYFGGRKVLQGTLTLGVLTVFVAYLWQLYRPIHFFCEINNFFSRAFAGAERIFEILDTKRELAEDPEALPMPEMDGRVAFDDVAFAYERGKPVLKGIELEVEPGEMIGLVGRSGVGKTTLINLICRFYDPERGGIAIDGVDLRKIRLEDLRIHIGMVHQEPFLFDGTMAENIAYSKPDATFEEIVRAAKAAEAHEFIVQKPDGYDMKVGERGGKLAGGEKQRISIARAILHDPRILILDEAMSSLDTPTERKIQAAVSRLVEGRTTFAIAHRLSTLRRADRLVVLDDGEVAEVGTHAELMERQGIFYRLVQTQQKTTAMMEVGGGKEETGK